METAFVSLICIALMVIGGMTMSQGFLHSIDNTSTNIQVISQRDQEILRTNITVLSAEQSAADTLEVCLRNDGHTKLASFDRWDLIVFYHDAGGADHAVYLPYTLQPLSNNQWNLGGIYIDCTGLSPEVFDPGIFNPNEEMIIRCQLSPPVGPHTVNLISVATPNGVTVTRSFTGFNP
jgi:hypothetical protein